MRKASNHTRIPLFIHSFIHSSSSFIHSTPLFSFQLLLLLLLNSPNHPSMSMKEK
eukprot:EC791546.1.p1 GENE.EC791546.1~~EC791546.1.p1  ORF type:complete len:55 (+),score=7.08 EC791546.1:159-323(+)